MQSPTLESAAAVLLLIAVLGTLASCASSEEPQSSAQPPERIQAWMDRLTVEHEYDPETGFIVAREVITLPPVLTLVIARLEQSPALATHIEVDREGDAADRYLGGRAIPMTYLLRDGQIVATLRGQRSASDLLEWLNDNEL